MVWMKKGWVVCGLLWNIGASVAVANASEHLPDRVRDALQLECAPPCTLCHSDQSGGFGTAVKPFVQDLPEVLSNTAAAMESARTHDSDGDGVNDVDELIENTDPNSPDNDPVCGGVGSDVRYGCGARVAPAAGVNGWHFNWGFCLSLGMALLLLRLRR
jgi:hypothetical protein